MGSFLCTGRKNLGNSLSDLEGPLVETKQYKQPYQYSDMQPQQLHSQHSRDQYSGSQPTVGPFPAKVEKQRLFSDLPEVDKLPSERSESEESVIGTMAAVPNPIRWRKGEIIGSGAYGRVYMGMNLDSGELIAVKQVLLAVGGTNNRKAQNHLRSLEEEVDLLRNLSHPNIVRYLGTQREEEALNIFLEFVPGGSIASLLSKFGSFTEKVIQMYTRQILLGLDYLHGHKIMHRDIKGANILVDNKGGIKLADFGASKKLADLATISHGNRSLTGTPYWMAPEVIKQTGHGRQADIWSVGCTVYEMAAGKPPWSEYQSDVAALFHIAQSESPPPIPSHLSCTAQDFILLCLQRDPKMRPNAAALLQHPFLQLGTHTLKTPPPLPPPRTTNTTTSTSGRKSEHDTPLSNGRSSSRMAAHKLHRDSTSSPTSALTGEDQHALPRGALHSDVRGSSLSPGLPQQQSGQSRKGKGSSSSSNNSGEMEVELDSPSASSTHLPHYSPHSDSSRQNEGKQAWAATSSGRGWQQRPGASREDTWVEQGSRCGSAGESFVSVEASVQSDFNPMEEPSYMDGEEGSTLRSSQRWGGRSNNNYTTKQQQQQGRRTNSSSSEGGSEEEVTGPMAPAPAPAPAPPSSLQQLRRQKRQRGGRGGGGGVEEEAAVASSSSSVMEEEGVSWRPVYRQHSIRATAAASAVSPLDRLWLQSTRREDEDVAASGGGDRGDKGGGIESPNYSLDGGHPTEERIRRFLQEKALELKRLQSPLMEDMAVNGSAGAHSDNTTTTTPLLPRGHSPPTDTAQSDGHWPHAGLPLQWQQWPEEGQAERERDREVEGGRGGMVTERESGGSSASESSLGQHRGDSTGSGEGKGGKRRGKVERMGDAALEESNSGNSPKGASKKQQWEEELQRELASKREEKRKHVRHKNMSTSHSSGVLSSSEKC